MRKLTRKRLKKKTDETYKDWMRKNVPYKCPTCLYWNRSTATQNLHWGHIITATKLATRYDKKNVFWQCDPCNFLHEQYPEKYINWFIDTYGLEEWRDLCKRSNAKINNYDIYYHEILKQYN